MALALGCATGGIDPSELPDAPIAFVYYSQGQGRTIAESRELNRSPDDLRFDADRSQRADGSSSVAHLRLRPEELRGQLTLLDPRNGEMRRVEQAPRGAWPLDWARSERRLLFAADTAEGPQLFSLDSGDLVLPLTHGPEQHAWGSFGPDRSLVVASLSEGERGATQHIVLKIGGGSIPLSKGPSDRDPVWSPDGRSVVWVATLRDGGSALMAVRDLAQPEQRMLGRGSDPTFTPDGEWIVYSRPTREGSRLWRMRVDGSGKQPLGRGLGDEKQPTVSPDGRYVAFVVSESSRNSLFLRRLEDGATRLLLSNGDGVRPVWAGW